MLVACGFSNSSGLPITLLSALHAHFSATSDIGRIDPTFFLSVYLLLYPVLQWGIGGWLLAPPDDERESAAIKPMKEMSSQCPSTMSLDPQTTEVLVSPRRHVHVLSHRRALSSKVLSNGDEGIYISNGLVHRGL